MPRIPSATVSNVCVEEEGTKHGAGRGETGTKKEVWEGGRRHDAGRREEDEGVGRRRKDGEGVARHGEGRRED